MNTRARKKKKVRNLFLRKKVKFESTLKNVFQRQPRDTCERLKYYSQSFERFVTTHTHTRAFNDSFSGTTQVSQYQKGTTNLDFTEARDSEWQWH